MAYFGNAGQTSIDLPDVGIVGDGADLASNPEDASAFGAANGSGGNVSMGTMVKYGATPDTFLPLSAGTDVNLLAGIVGFDYSLANPEQVAADANGDGAIPPNVVAPIRRQKRVNVRVAASKLTWTPLPIATAGGVGRFAATGTTTKTINCSAFCKWVAPAGAGGVAVLEIDMTNSELAVAD